jgi:hypothetical protein
MSLATNDLQITNGDLSLVTGSDAIAQDLQQRLQSWLGEWFLDTTWGIPFKQQILVKNPNLDLIQADILLATTDTPGVVQVTDFDFIYDNNARSLSVKLTVQDSNGQNLSSQVTIAPPNQPTIEGTVYP